ncbi:alpha-protein kinase 3 [Otolemur garnettii]|nr:alpha-protein kinase 3 [Otolemur garnettii]
MGSRRIPTRGWGAGGRAGTGGDGEDEGPVWIPSPASRSYLLNVRPETSLSSNQLSHPSSGRSTFCSIIAQLTEETQPLFETTLKSRAVSEDSDVRFTCIVTGYPEPEVTWYKDDTELDRYCGLPKYEITHQGNRHTLQLYRCQEEDAAVYQASARNSKGIASCSGVLEVGTMTEYKIHQRWFAKLKLKAAAKLREIEQSWRHEKKAVGEADTLRKLSPDRFQRKRRLSGAEAPVPSASTREAEGGALAAQQKGETESAQNVGLGLISSFATGEVTTNGEAAPENGEDGEHGLLTYICDAMERGPQKPPQKESGAKKKKKGEESKQGLQNPELEKAARSHCSSENRIPSSDKPDSRRTQESMGMKQAQTQSRGRVAQEPGSSGPDSAREQGSAVGIQDKVWGAPAPAPAPGPDQEGYFSLKDMYVESTQAVRLQENRGPQPQSVEALGEDSSGKALIKAAGGEVPAAPGQPTPSTVTQSTKPFNRKRFAPPKPKAESTSDSKPISSLNQVPELEAQNSGKTPPQASAQVPTPPARQRHRTWDSPSQGKAGHRTPGGGLESQATVAPTLPASSSPNVASVGYSTSRSQGAIKSMDMETQEDERTSADQAAGGKKNMQAAGKVQVDGRTQGEQAQTRQRIQADSKVRAGVVTQDSERPQSGRCSQKDVGVVTQKRMEMQGEKPQADKTIQEGRRAQADGRVQEDRWAQAERGTQSEGTVTTAMKVRSEQEAMTSLSPPRTAPELSPSKGPQSPQIIEYFMQTPEGSCVPEKSGFMPRSEVAAATASRNHEEIVLGPLSGNLMLPSQLLPAGSLEQVGGGTQQGPDLFGPVTTDTHNSLFQYPKEEQPGGASCVDLGGCPPAGLCQGVPTVPPPPGTALTSSPKEELPSTPTSQHMSTAAFLPSADQALLSSASTLHLGPETPTQSHPSETMATSNKGACAKVPDVEEGTSSSRTCDPGLIDSLKNYLLLLLKLSTAEPSGAGTEIQAGAATGSLEPSLTLVPTVEVAGLSPRTSRRILDRVENNHLVQSAQTLLLSPRTTRRLTGLLDREVQAGHQALATGRGSQGTGLSPLAVPAIVVGEEGPGLASEESRQDEGEVSLEGPGLLGAFQESSMAAPLVKKACGQAVSGEGLLSAEARAQEPSQEEEFPGEAPTGLPAATPEELALGARRKRFLPKARAVGEAEASKPEEKESPMVSPRGSRKSLAPGSPETPERERCSPTQGRKVGMLEVPRTEEEPAARGLGPSPKASGLDESKQEALPKPRKAKDLLKAPQVIRKIRVEQFPDASGSLKLWCQFFNILSDSVLTWAKDQRPVGEVGRSAGDEGPAALAIVQASLVDCGVYRCTIHNEHGSASTDFCLSPEALSGFVSREEGEVGEEIEMTPMVFAKGLADSGCWGDKLFGRLVSEELRGSGHGGGLRKASQAKVIYGLEPIFESGRTCVIKVSSLLVFGPSSETSLLGRNYDVTIQGCKIQNMSREYCRIFAAEARAAPGFGAVPEIIPLYLIYRPANNIPYATLEEDLGKPLESYCSREGGCAGAPAASSNFEVMQKCQTFQHWLYQWTNGSFLVTDLAGVDWKMTDVQIATKLRGYQGLKESCFPALLDQFASSHQCNAYCEMLGLTALKGPEAAYLQTKAKGSKSPSAGRKGTQLSPQPQKKGLPSPQGTRKSTLNSKGTPQASEPVAIQLLGQPPTQEEGLEAQVRR